MRRTLYTAAIATLVLASTASAQRARTTSPAGETPIELGFDGSISFGQGGTNNTTDIDIPVGSIRAGWMLNPTWSIEPQLAYHRESATNESGSVYMIGVGALYHFSANRAETQFYARPFINLNGFSSKVQTSPTTTVSTSDSYTDIGAGVGVKVPWKDRLGWRFEANYAHSSKQLASGDNRLGLLFGVSYFTH